MEMEEERNKSNITSEIWKGGKEDMEKLIAKEKKSNRENNSRATGFFFRIFFKHDF
jgi:hypothetical protein